MALISDALGIVVAIVIFIFLVALFYKVFGSLECEKLAISTAEALRVGIDKVGLEDKVSPYYGEGIPPDNAKDQFAVVPIRLCQRSTGGDLTVSIPFVNINLATIPLPFSTGSALSAQMPDYILVYETFPESPFWGAWTESKPFESGAVNSIMTYAVIRWGPKVLYNIGKFIAKGAILKYLIKIPILGEKLLQYLYNHRDNRIIRWMLRAATGSLTESGVSQNIPERLLTDFYKDADKTTIETLRTMVLQDGFEEVDALANLGVIESQWDPTVGKFVPITSETYYYKSIGAGVVREEAFIVNPEFRSLFKTYIELAPNEELKKLYKESFYIPSWGSRFGTEKIKQTWYKVQYSLLNNRFTKWFSNNVIDRTKNAYYSFKNGLRKVFHLNTVDRFDNSLKTASYKKWAFMHFDQFRAYVLDDDNFYNMGFESAIEEATGKILLNPSLVSDEDLYKFLTKYDRYYNTFPYEEFISSSTGQVRSFAVNNLVDVIDDEADKAIRKGDWGAWMTFKNKWGLAWDQMTDTQKDDWVSTFMKGYTGPPDQLPLYDAGVIYSDLRANLIKEGVLDQGKIITHGKIRTNMFQSLINNIKGEMFSTPLRNYNFIYTDEFANAIPNFWLRPVAPLTQDWLQRLHKKLSSGVNALKNFKDMLTNNKLYKKTRQFIILDLGRFGISPLSPFDPVAGGGPFTTREALRRSSQVMEGGCSEKSICMLEAGGVKGPEEGASAFLLDENITSQVKLWRPKPGLNARTPTWISTSMFYASVAENPRFHVISPCFASAKIWKSGRDGNIYVNIDKSNKCNVTSCPTGIDTPNYCYADEEYIWGQDAFSKGNMITTGDAPSTEMYVGGAIACTIAIGSVTHDYWSALKTCSYISMGILTGHTVGASQVYRDVPSWKRQETGWGYWNYQKAGDICDILDIMASVGSWRSNVAKKQLMQELPQSTLAGQPLNSVAAKPSFLSKLKKNIGAGDLCYFLLTVGDTSLAWPIKTAFPEIWRKGAGLNETCMQETAAECAWVNKTT